MKNESVSVTVLGTKRSLKTSVYEFFAGLNRELDNVRGRILDRRPLPSTHEAFDEVQREENM